MSDYSECSGCSEYSECSGCSEFSYVLDVLNILDVLNAPLISSALIQRRYLFKNIKHATLHIPVFSLFLHPTDILLTVK